MDLSDQASEREAQDLALALKHRQPAGPAATGYCLAGCGASLPEGQRWCDAECREDWQLQNSARG